MNHCVKLICLASLSAMIFSSCSTYKEGRGNFPAIPDELPFKWEYNLDKEKDKENLAFEDLSLDIDTAEYRADSSLDVELLSYAIPTACSDYSEHTEEYFNLPNPTVDTREYKTVCEGDNKVTTPIQQFSITDEEIEMLKYIVEQETRGGSYKHKCIVTNVILNRVKDSRFPNTVREVLLQKNQFSSTWNYYQKKNKPDESTVNAVNDVLNGKVEDESNGSLYFHSMKNDGWFSSLTFVMEFEGHRFFK